MTEPRRPDDTIPLLPALILVGGITLILIALLTIRPSTRPGAELAILVSPTPTESPTLPPSPTPQTVAALDPHMVTAGENTFQSVCAACHGFNANGIPGLGKPLIGSTFVNGLSDDELLAFLNVGRDVTDPLNTTGVMMPAKGGNPNLSDDNLREIIAYIRSLNQDQPVQAAVEPTAVAAAVTSAPIEYAPPDLSVLQVPTSAAPQSDVPSLFLTSGQVAYQQACASCHAADGSGVEYMAQPLAESALLQEHAGIALFNFLISGQSVNDQSGIPHPARGGYPALTDDQILSLIAYLYSLPTP